MSVRSFALLSALLLVACGGDSGTTPIDDSVVSVSISPSSLTLDVGETGQFHATTHRQDGVVTSDANVQWSSSDLAVSSVDSRGRVTAHARGTATLTATAEAITANALVTVLDPVAGVNVAPDEATLEIDETQQLSATVLGESGAELDDPVDWSSSDEDVATVTGQGLITGVAIGTAEITATASGISGSMTVTVIDPVVSVTVSPDGVTLEPGLTAQLSVTVVGNSGAELTTSVEWDSDDDGIATVDATGLVTGVAPGTAEVTATAEDVSGAATVTVRETSVFTDAAVEMEPTALTEVGQVVQARVVPLSQYDEEMDLELEITWTSADSAVASVSRRGFVTALTDGQATIVADVTPPDAGPDATSATATPLSREIEVDVAIADPPDEARRWEAVCLLWDNDGELDPALSTCIDARAWAWVRAEGKELILEVRNLQGSIGGTFDTATRTQLERVVLGWLATPEGFGTDLAAPTTFEPRGDLQIAGDPVWVQGTHIPTDLGFSAQFPSAFIGCGTVDVPADHQRTCLPESLDGFLRIRAMTVSKDWNLEGVSFGMGLRVFNEQIATYVGCRSTSNICSEYTLDEILPEGG